MKRRQIEPATESDTMDLFAWEKPDSRCLPAGWGMVEEQASDSPGAEWFAVRTRTKGEHIAAAQLQVLEGVETFCPRIRFQKTTRRGEVWFVEALFPGYVFAHFNADEKMRLVNATSAVSGVVQFGTEYPTISAHSMQEMRAAFLDDREMRVIQPGYEAGDEVEIMKGPLQGLQALVTRVMPGTERIAILMEWLGGSHEAEVSMRDVSRSIGAATTTGDEVRLAAAWN